MSNDFFYDDSRLRRMLEQLSMKERTKAVKGAFATAARELRKKAVANMRSSGLRSNRNVERGIRAVTYKKVPGFRITVGTRRRKVNYEGLSGTALTLAKKKAREAAVVALWAEGGTVRRKTRRAIRKGRFISGRNTGAMPAYEFMKKTEAESPMTGQTLEKEILKSIEKAVIKNGGSIK